MEHSGNQAESVVALLVVLGSSTAEDLAPAMLITSGMMVWRRANVSSSMIICNCMTKTKAVMFASFDECSHMCEYQQSRHLWLFSPCATHAGPSRSLGETVAVVGEVLGSETAAALVKPSLIIIGTRASGPAKRERSPRELAADSQTRRND